MTSPKKKAAAPVTSKAKLASLVKSARDTMRKDAGLNGDLDRLPQLSWLLFLKAFDERVEQPGPVLDPDCRPAIEAPYRWQDWAADPDFSGKELTEFVNRDLIPYLAGLKGRNADDPRNVLSTIFKDVNNRMLAGSLLRDLVEVVNQIHFSSSDDIHTMAFVYESILKEMRDAAGDSGEFYTPRPVNRFMVQQSFLQLGESILDPACGTGGFLVQAYEDLSKVLKDKGTTDTEKKRLHSNLRGIEKKPLPYLLASMNLLLHGIDTPRLVRFNALDMMRDATAADRVDVVITNPPFGGEEEKSIVDKFPSAYRTQETAWLFVHAILDQLKTGGRCAIVLPNGSLFAGGVGGVGARIKEKLMKECNLHTVVRLPQGVFAPYTQIPSNLLFFEKTGPTEQTWFYEVPLPAGRRGYAKTKPMRFEEFDGCVEWWGGEKRAGREAGPQAWVVPAEAIKQANYSLDIPNPHVGDDLAHGSPDVLVGELADAEAEICRLLKKLQRELREGIDGKAPDLTEYAVDDVIKLVRRSVTPELDKEYREINIRSFGNGIFHKPPVTGQEIASKKVFRIEPGDLVVSSIFAWEGAVAVASDAEEGMIGSHRFMTYRVNEEIADERYLLRYFHGGPGLDMIRQASPGSAGRNRTLGIKAFGSKRISLPSISEQRRIADKLDILRRLNEIQRHRDSLAASLRPAVFRAAFSGQI